MKKKSLALIIFIIIIVQFLFQSKDIVISKFISDCKETPCKISFVLTNKTNYRLQCNVSLRSHKRTPGVNTSGAVSPGFAGEKILELQLYPKEIKEVKDTLLLRGSSTRIRVNVYNIQKSKL